MQMLLPNLRAKAGRILAGVIRSSSRILQEKSPYLRRGHLGRRPVLLGGLGGQLEKVSVTLHVNRRKVWAQEHTGDLLNGLLVLLRLIEVSAQAFLDDRSDPVDES